MWPFGNATAETQKADADAQNFWNSNPIGRFINFVTSPIQALLGLVFKPVLGAMDKIGQFAPMGAMIGAVVGFIKGIVVDKKKPTDAISSALGTAVIGAGVGAAVAVPVGAVEGVSQAAKPLTDAVGSAASTAVDAVTPPPQTPQPQASMQQNPQIAQESGQTKG